MREYLKLSGLLVSAVLCVAAYAYWPETWTLTLAKADLPFVLEQDSLPIPEPETVPAEETPAKPEKDTTSQRILLIGDSMIEELTFGFSNYAHANGHRLETVIWYGSSTEQWARTDTLSSFVSQFQPTFIVVCLGSNELFLKHPERRAPYIRSLVHAMNDIPFVWLCPPRWKMDSGICNVILQEVGEQRFFDSTRLQLSRKKDLRHPNRKGADLWMEAVAKWLSGTETAHPIALDSIPSKNVKRCTLHLLQPMP